MEYLCKGEICIFFMRNSKLCVEVILLSDWNEQAAPNNNIPPRIVRPFERRDQKVDHEFSEELADGGERDEFIQHQKKK
jgi:hypothetical protein